MLATAASTGRSTAPAPAGRLANTRASLRTGPAPLRAAAPAKAPASKAPTDIEYDAIVIGSGMGGLTSAAKLATKGANVLLLEKYIIPGGSAGHFKKEGYTFDVGSSMMFGFGDKGTTNLLTKALETVGKKIDTVPDPCQIHYHLPKSADHKDGLEIFVWRDYEEFIEHLQTKFPDEKEGIRKMYDEAWNVFNALNSLELKSLEEPRYLMGEFFKEPVACLTLAWYMITNTGPLARKYIKNEELLKFIDMECFCWSTVSAEMTPFINAGMVLCDRHYGGINYPVGGVGRIPELMAEGIEEAGGHIEYKAPVSKILTEGSGDDQKAVGVQLQDGREYRAKKVISNATRWDTFEKMLGEDRMPTSEKKFREGYEKSPSFFTIHLGIKAEALPEGTYCHHIVLEDWDKMYDTRGTLFVSIPTTLDPSCAPEGRHVFHAFTPDFIDNWQGLSREEYQAEKERVANEMIDRLAGVFPKLREPGMIEFAEYGTPRTHMKFLNREDGTYGPIPSKNPLGMLSMPLNTTSVDSLYCVGDSTFPGQGVNAVVFSGFGCAHRAAVDLGLEEGWPIVDKAFKGLLDGVRDGSNQDK